MIFTGFNGKNEDREREFTASFILFQRSCQAVNEQLESGLPPKEGKTTMKLARITNKRDKTRKKKETHMYRILHKFYGRAGRTPQMKISEKEKITVISKLFRKIEKVIRVSKKRPSFHTFHFFYEDLA